MTVEETVFEKTLDNLKPETVQIYAAQFRHDMETVAQAVIRDLSAVASVGLQQGHTASHMANMMGSKVTLIGIARTKLVINSAVAGVFTAGQLDAFERLKVKTVRIDPESTDGGESCQRCLGLAKNTYTPNKARGVLPVHVGCFCVWVPG